MASIQGIYIALFGRPADPTGLAYFNGVTKNGADLSGIGNLAGQREYLDRFVGKNTSQIINSIYQSLFGREADPVGLSYFTEVLTSGRQTINTIAINIFDGAQGQDKAIISNKVAAANLFTSHLDTQDEIASYAGTNATTNGINYLSAVNADPASLSTPDEVDGLINLISFGVYGGLIFRGTGGPGNLVGTISSDSFWSVTEKFTGNGLTIDGRAGYDSLSIGVSDAIIDAGTPTLKNIESVSLYASKEASINLGSSTGIQQFQAGSPVTKITGADFTTVFSVAHLATQTTISLASEVDLQFGAGSGGIARLEVGDARAGSSVAFNLTTGTQTALAGASLTIDNENLATVSLDGLAGASNISVGGTGHVALTALQLSFTSFDASANTGGVEWKTGALASAATITGSSGADTFDLSATTKAVTVSMGAGADTVVTGTGGGKYDLGVGDDILTVKAGAGHNVVTLGAGADQVILSAATASVFTADLAHFTTISDFGASDDVLSLKGAGPFTFASQTETQAITTGLAALTSAATLANAVALVDAALSVGESAIFQFHGNTYVFGDTTASQDGINDVLVELTGNVALTGTHLVLG